MENLSGLPPPHRGPTRYFVRLRHFAAARSWRPPSEGVDSSPRSGLRLRDGRVVPAFIGQALSGQPLTVFGDGSQTRSFCYVSDLIDGIFRLAMSDFHEPVNIGNPREMTIKQFAEEIIRITGTKSTIEYKPLPVDDPKVRQPDITRAKEVLSWEPRVEFDEGIKETIEYFKESLNS